MDQYRGRIMLMRPTRSNFSKFGMLNSCASGVTVVNIDNGFGAAFAATLINRVGIAREGL